VLPTQFSSQAFVRAGSPRETPSAGPPPRPAAMSKAVAVVDPQPRAQGQQRGPGQCSALAAWPASHTGCSHVFRSHGAWVQTGVRHLRVRRRGRRRSALARCTPTRSKHGRSASSSVLDASDTDRPSRKQPRSGERARACCWCVSITQSRSTATLVDCCFAARRAARLDAASAICGPEAAVSEDDLCSGIAEAPSGASLLPDWNEFANFGTSTQRWHGRSLVSGHENAKAGSLIAVA
jgi:hypothetical protein